MDSIDHTIIRILQINARTSLKSISNQVNLSLPAVRERLKKLEQTHYIKQCSAILDHAKFGKLLTCFCFIMLKAQDTEHQELFFSFVKNNSSILECHCVAGEKEYMLKIVTESMQTLEQFLGSLRQEWGVLRSSTFAVLSSIKEQPGFHL